MQSRTNDKTEATDDERNIETWSIILNRTHNLRRKNNDLISNHMTPCDVPVERWEKRFLETWTLNLRHCCIFPNRPIHKQQLAWGKYGMLEQRNYSCWIRPIKKSTLPMAPPQTIAYVTKSVYVLQNGTSSVATPARANPILLASKGVMNGILVIQPEAKRTTVLLKPREDGLLSKHGS